MTTQDLIKNLRQLMPLGPQIATLVNVAADRLEELQREIETNDPYMWRKHWDEAIQQRDEARAQVERLKLEPKTIIQQTTFRPEPSRLEIAAMLKAGWFANRDSNFDAGDSGWWIEQADKLIAAAREAK